MTSSQDSVKDRSSVRCLFLSSSVLLALAFASTLPGCGNSDGGTSGGTGGASSGTGGTTTTGTGGSASSGSGGNTSGSGGTTASGSGGSTSSGSGGATSVGSGGSSVSGSGGSSSGSGGSGAALPACTTQAKGGACLSATDACAKNCGPKNAANASVGTKSETCTGATYVEGLCEFPPGDYACFKVTATTAACPTGTMASAACTINSCLPCSGYNDSAGAAKVGYCHCVNNKWSCGSTKEWPCQSNGTSTTTGGTGC